MWRSNLLVLAVLALVLFQVLVPMTSAEGVGGVVDESLRLSLEKESASDSSFAQSLTRDFLFFATFVGQVILFLIFFWEKPTTPRRWHVGEEAATEVGNEETAQADKPEEVGSESASSSAPGPNNRTSTTTIATNASKSAVEVSGASKDKPHTEIAPLTNPGTSQVTSPARKASKDTTTSFVAPPEGSRATSDDEGAQQLEEEFAPLEATIKDLQHRIAGLERTLSRRKGTYPTESLKTRLRDCISTITGTLSQLDGPNSKDAADLEDRPSSPTNRLDITKWNVESFQSSKRQLELQLEQLEAGFVQQESPKTRESIVEKQSDAIDKSSNKTPSNALLDEFDLDVQDLDMLESKLGAGKKGRKGGKVKITGKNMNAFNLFVDQPIAQQDPASRTFEEPKIDSSVSEQPKEASPKEDSPKKPAVVVIEESKDDEADELERLSAALNTGKKCGKAAGKASGKPAEPANIFNMFAAPSAKKKVNDTSSDEEENDSTSDLLKQLEGFKPADSKNDDVKDLLAGLGDFSLPKSSPSGGDATNDLMAALNAFSPPAGSDSDDSESGSSSDTNDSETSSNTSDDLEDEIARERPLVSGFGVASALNKSGLARAKKSVPLNKSGKKGSYQMEDYNFCEFPWMKPNWGLFCVFDGHSGKDCAESAQTLVPKHFKTFLDEVDLEANPGQDLTDVFTKAFLAADKDLTEFEYEGSTCTVIFIYKTSSGRRYLQVGNVGDSGATLIRKKVAIELTVDHHPNHPIEKQRLKEIGIEINDGQTRLNGLAVSRALGDHFPKSVESGIIGAPTVSPVFELASRDSYVVLASDGLWDVITYQKSYDIVETADTPQEMADALLKTATRSSKCTDNVTTVVILL